MKTKSITTREDYLATHPKEAAVQKATIKTICTRIGTFRKEAEKFGTMAVKLCNDARNIGAYIVELWESLPGKQMTTDFWHQMADLFVDQHGQKITIEQLKVFVRIHTNIVDEIKDPQTALSWKQEIMGAAGFQLTAGTVGTGATDADFYNKLLKNLDPRRIAGPLDGLIKDEHYGPVISWPQERKDRVILQVDPTKQAIDKLWEELHAKTIAI